MKTEDQASFHRRSSSIINKALPPAPPEFPSATQALINTLASQPNPEDKAWFLSRWTFSWVAGLARLGNKTLFKQEFHPLVSKDDDIAKTYPILEKAYNANPDASIIKAIKSAYGGMMCFIIFLDILKVLMDSGIILIMYFVVKKTQDDEKLAPEERDMYMYVGLFCGILGCQFGSALFYNYLSYWVNKTALRISSSISYMIYQKILDVSTLNPSAHSEGSIINHIQVDCVKLNNVAVGAIIAGVDSIFQMCFALTFGVFIFGWVFLVFPGVYFFFSMMSMLIMKIYIKNPKTPKPQNPVSLNSSE